MRNPWLFWICGVAVLLSSIGMTGCKPPALTQVVITLPNIAQFDYALKKSLSDDACFTKKKQLSELLAQPTMLGATTVDAQQVSVDVNNRRVTIVTEPADVAETRAQFAKINKAMVAVFGAGQFTAQSTDALFDKESIRANREANQSRVGAILQARLSSSGLRHVTYRSIGDNQVVLEMPKVKYPDDVKRILRASAQLEFYLIPKDVTVSVNDTDNSVSASINGMPVQGTSAEITKRVLDQSRKVITGADMQKFEYEYSQNHPAIGFTVKPEKQGEFSDMTAGHIGYVLAIMMDHKFMMLPVIKAAITSNGVIEGDFTERDAQEWVRLLNAGSLPVPVTITEMETITPGQSPKP